MDGEPDGWFIVRCFRHPMNAVGRDKDMVAGTEILVTNSVDPETC